MADPSASDHPVFALSDRFVDDLVELSPMTASSLGITGHDDRWDDCSPAGHDAHGELLRRYRRSLDRLPPADDEWAALAVQVLQEHLTDELEPIEHGDHLRDLGHVQSLVPTIPGIFDLMPTDTIGDWRNIAARLDSIVEPLAGLRQCLEAGQADGLVASQRQVRSIIEQLGSWTIPGGALHRLVTDFAAGPLEDPLLAGRLADGLQVAAATAGALATWLEVEYLPGAAVEDGVGDERYARHARSFLGTTLDLEGTYRWGWDHLLEIRGQMMSRAALIEPGRDLATVVAGLAADPRWSARTQDQFQHLMLNRIRQAIVQLSGRHFDIPEQIRSAEVRLAPRGSPLGAWFVPPSEDFTRPGTTWWSIGDRCPVPLWDEVSTAYHEGFPGHHLQFGIQVALGDRLSRAHRLLVWVPGYGEGWALYAERLMHELGYFEEPAYELGWLAGSALRAVRVAIDIGCHLGLRIPDDVPFHPGERWTFDHGVEALERLAFQPHDLAVSEMTRYLGWPGQAIAYAVGEREILRLRREVRARAGARFELKSFHQQVLGHGTVGLDHLRRLVLG